MSVLEPYENLEKRLASISGSREEKLLFIATNTIGPEDGANRFHFQPANKQTIFWFLGPQGIRRMKVSSFVEILLIYLVLIFCSYIGS